MIDTAKLKEKILDLAIRGKLVSQDPNDEPASVLLEKVRAEKLQMVKEGKLKQKDIKDDSVIFVGEDNLHYEKFTDGSIKCIEDEIPFDIPKSWAWCRLNTISKNIFAGGDKPALCVKIQNNNCNIPIYSNGIENNGLYGFTDQAKVNESSITISARGTIGFCYVREKPFVPIVRLITIIPYNQINVYYLSYVFNKLTSNGKGSSIPQLTVPDVKPKLIPLPPANEMNKIVDCITNTLLIIQKMKTEEAEIKNMSNHLKSKILDMAIRGKLVPQDPNDEPADVLLERIRKEKEELIKQGKIKRDKKESIIFKGDDNSYYEIMGTEKQNLSDQINFSLPENWSISRLESICKLCNGIKINNEKLPYLDAKTLRKVKNPEFRTSGEMVLPGTKLILVDGENSGEVFIADIKGYLGSTFKILYINDNINHEYINLILFFYKSVFKENKTGSAVPHLNKKLFKDLIIGIPPSKEQERIVMLVTNTFKTLNLIQNNL